MNLQRSIQNARAPGGTGEVGGQVLSHHAIMALVRPFSRAGYTLDLSSSDRGRGILVFRPVELPAELGRRPALRCSMRLERPHRAKLRVIRTLETHDGLTATMTAEGDDVETLLEVVEQVEHERQFHRVDPALVPRRGPLGDLSPPVPQPPRPTPIGISASESEPNTCEGEAGAGRAPPADGVEAQGQPFAQDGEGRSVSIGGNERPWMARSYFAEVWSAQARRDLWSSTPSPRLTQAEVRLGSVRMMAAATSGNPFEVRLTTEGGDLLELPSDFLAVVGWRWRPLRRGLRDTWLGSVRPPRWEPRRTATLERQLDVAAGHILDSLAAAPAIFHSRHRGARWRTAFQRFLPLLSLCGTVLAFVWALFYLPKTPLVHIVMLHLSFVAVGAFRMMDEAYRIEVPPPPRPLTQEEWVAPASRRS